jgi:carboxyl-terminal processing protease
VQIHSVPYATLFPDGTGYIKLEGFQQKCSQEVRQALAVLKGQGMHRLIFDLRGNGGGYLTEAVQIANFFLPKDRLVVFTAGRALRDTTRYVTQEEPLLDKEPLVVLVDYGSASASEIVAGAVQDWDRGLVLGMPTVGKGSVQQTIPIDDKAELKLTMAAYFTPSGRSIDKRMRKDSTLVGSSDRVFKTRVRERIVHGGGGIYPDVYLESRKSTPLFSQLSGMRNLDSKFFRYARQYQLRRPQLGPGFRADDETLRDFRGFAAAQGFEYLSDPEALLQELDKKIAAQKESERFDKLLKRVRLEINDLEEKDWQANRELLEWKLTFDILEKSFGVEAANAYEAEVDPHVLQARQILSEPGAYEQRFAKPEIGEPREQVATTPAETADELSDR